jgi:hypothetical protein
MFIRKYLAVLTKHPGFGPLQTGRGVFGVFHGGQNFAGINQHVLARGGQAHLLAAPVKQGHAHMAFEFLDLHGHGGRGQVQVFGGTHKAQVTGHLVEHAKLAEGGVLHSVFA